MDRIHVTVRARPLSQEEGKATPWKISGNSIFIPNNSTKFEFDRVFGESDTTKEVYEARTKEIVAASVDGFNGTVFAYGQTNSGKTYTMRGSTAEPGLIPLAIHDLFGLIQEDANREFLLRVSYMEIYNEDINDLLAPEHRKLQIHESLERGIYVAGLREEIVASPQHVLDLMQFGESHRHIGETNMNLYSSRSHTIFCMIIESHDQSDDDDSEISCDAVRVSVLNLVDLAGSERAVKTGAEGVRLKEGSHINKSLMTLGTVIKKLSEGIESQGGHVPYRDSKLTRILQPALGGNANTAIICNITLDPIHTDETKSSLQFANRALHITNCAHVNEILTNAALLKRQKKEIEELLAKLQGSRYAHLEEEILNLRNTLLQLELERERTALELEEERRVQAEQEKVMQEQAKKIENLSSMVLYSNMDESHDQQRKQDYKNMEAPTFAMESAFASLENELAASQKENGAVSSNKRTIVVEFASLAEKLNISYADLALAHKEVSDLRQRLEDSLSSQQKMENCINLLIQEKEELAMQLTVALLEVEEEKATWLAIEKSFFEAAAKEKATWLSTEEITSLTRTICEAEEHKERTKMRMQLRGTQARLDAFRLRYCEVVEELNLMNQKYEDCSRKLKDKLAFKGMEVINLKKQLAAAVAR